MKRLLSLVLLLATSASAYHQDDRMHLVDMSQYDKKAHFVGTALVSYGTYRIYRLQYSEWTARALAFATTMVMGHLKETHDYSYDLEDLQADALGASFGLVFTF